MARPRKLRTDLPECVYFRSGAYYYVTGGVWTRLGKTYKEAMLAWAELVKQPGGPVVTVSDLLDRYTLEVIPTKSERTQKDNRNELRYLRAFFGSMPVRGVRPKHVAEYISTREAKVRANREVALLSHAFNKAILWEIATTNPCSVPGLRNVEKPRDRYVTDEEIEHFKEWCPKWLKTYIDLKLLLGLRKQDMLELHWADMDDRSIFVHTQKTGVKLAIARTKEVNSVLDRILTKSGHLFQTTSGTAYSSEGFDSAWQRAKAKYLSNGGQPFNEHDLRGKVATDMNNLEAAKNLLGHSSITMTEDYVKAKSVKHVQPATRKKTS